MLPRSNVTSVDFCPLETVLLKLETARKSLASGTYHKGTFDLIYEIIVEKTDNRDSRVRELTASVFYECTRFIWRFTFRDERHLQEVKLYAEELEVFVRDVNEMANDFCTSLEAFWGMIISNANSLLLSVENVLSFRLLDNPDANSSELMVVRAKSTDRYSFDAV